MSHQSGSTSWFQGQRKALRKRFRVDIVPILQIVGLFSGAWAGIVLCAALLGWVEVLCWTPAGWLLAIPAARMLLRRTPSRDGMMRLREAVVAGGGLGLIQGALFAVGMSATAQGGVTAAAVGIKLLFGLGMFAVVGFAGAVAGGLLAFTAASYWQRSLHW